MKQKFDWQGNKMTLILPTNGEMRTNQMQEHFQSHTMAPAAPNMKQSNTE